MLIHNGMTSVKLLVFTWNKTAWRWYCVVTYRSFVVYFFDVFAEDFSTYLPNCRLFDRWQTRVVHAELKLIYWSMGDRRPRRRTSLDILYPVADNGFFTSDIYVTKINVGTVTSSWFTIFWKWWMGTATKTFGKQCSKPKKLRYSWMHLHRSYLFRAIYEHRSLSTLVQ